MPLDTGFDLDWCIPGAGSSLLVPVEVILPLLLRIGEDGVRTANSLNRHSGNTSVLAQLWQHFLKLNLFFVRFSDPHALQCGFGSWSRSESSAIWIRIRIQIQKLKKLKIFCSSTQISFYRFFRNRLYLCLFFPPESGSQSASSIRIWNGIQNIFQYADPDRKCWFFFKKKHISGCRV